MPPEITAALLTLLNYIIDDPSKAANESYRLFRKVAIDYVMHLSPLIRHTWLDVLIHVRDTIVKEDEADEIIELDDETPVKRVCTSCLHLALNKSCPVDSVCSAEVGDDGISPAIENEQGPCIHDPTRWEDGRLPTHRVGE